VLVGTFCEHVIENERHPDRYSRSPDYRTEGDW
jgi:hypothetical protein